MLADMVVYFLGRSTTVDFISDKLLARCKKLYSPPTRVCTRSDSRVCDYFDHPASSFLSNHPPLCFYQGRFTLDKGAMHWKALLRKLNSLLHFIYFNFNNHTASKHKNHQWDLHRKFGNFIFLIVLFR